MTVYPPLCVGYTDTSLYQKASDLAIKLRGRVDNEVSPRLQLTATGLALIMEPFTPLTADFSIKTWQARHDAGKNQGLIRACKPRQGMTIIDATAGWGRDAAILASFGAKVVMLERNPWMSALLQDALERQDSHSRQLLQLQLVIQDGLHYLNDLCPEDYPDLIYIDPMHPVREQAALVKKELQALQKLLGPDSDAVTLLSLARTRTKQAVVVKWPQRLPPLDAPTRSIDGKTVRFDIYRTY